MSSVEIILIDKLERTITVRHMPQSQRELIAAVMEYWKEHELPWAIAEVIRFERPQRVFYSVLWIDGEDDESE